MEYTWNKNKAEKQLAYLLSALKTESSEYTKKEIRDGITCLKILLGITKVPSSSTFTFRDDVKLYRDFSGYSKIIRHANSIASRFPAYGIRYKEVDMSADEILSLTEKFYTSLDEKWRHIFYKIFNERHHNVKIDEELYFSQCVQIPYINYFYFQLRNPKTVEGVCDSIHEYAHGISDIMNPKYDTLFYKQILLEVPSIFMSLISCDFFKSISDNPREFDKYQKRYLDEMCNHFAVINYEYDILNPYFEQSEEPAVAYAAKMDIAPRFERYMYATSYLIAIELYAIYNQDKNKALSYLNHIITMEDQDCILEKLAGMNIQPGQNLQKFQNSLFLRLKKSNEVIHDNDEI